MSGNTDETAPLLRTSTGTNAPASRGAAVGQSPLLRYLRRHVAAILYLHLIVVEFGNYLQNAPKAAIYEHIICYNVVPKTALQHPVDCKSNNVQDELAFVRGMQEMLECLPGLFLAMPYGYLANHYSRKTILITALVGMCLQYSWVLVVTWFSSTFPLRLVWLSACFLIIGGGQPVSRSLAFVIASDVSTTKNRAVIFFRVEAVALIARAFSAGLSSYLMEREYWLPMSLGVMFIILGSLFALLLPMTRPTSNLITNEHGSAESDETPSLTENGDRKCLGLMIKAIARAMTHDKRVVLALSLVVIGQFSSRTTGLILQYAAKRYYWSFEKANLLLVERMLMTTVALLALVPMVKALTPHLPKLLRPSSQDLFLARFATMMLAVGLVFMTFAAKPSLMIAGIAVFSWGFCAFSALRSVLTTIVLSKGQELETEDGGPESESDHISILYTAMSLGQTVAKAAAGPFYAFLFQKGQRMGEVGQGLAFGIAAALALVVHLTTWTLKVSN